MKAIVLCAGMGTRLGELTVSTPKPLLKIKDVPILGHILKLLSENNFKEVAINTHFHSDQIVEYVGDGSQFGIKPHFFYEKNLLGTAGALTQMKNFISDSEFVLVIYGDLYIKEDLGRLVKAHKDMNADLTILLHRRSKSNSIVYMDETGRIKDFVERPSDEFWNGQDEVWVNSGIYIVSQKVALAIEGNFPIDFPRDIFPKIISSGKLYGFPLSGSRIAIDSPERLQEAEKS